jgi:hypothetical protein
VDRVVTRDEPLGGAEAAAASSSVEAQGGTVGTTVEGAPEATILTGDALGNDPAGQGNRI